jgi:fatty-acyl-CoA synthase
VEVESVVLVDDSYEALLAAADRLPIDEPVSLDDLSMVMYTSGTTGRPKGAMLTHGNLTWNAVNVLVDSDLRGDEVTLVCAPLFHTAGLNMTCLPTLLKGGTAVLMDRFDPSAALRLIERHGVTYLFGVPAMYDAMAAAPEWPALELDSLRTLTCGGAPVPDRTIRTYLDRGFTFVQGYGMTEASPGVLFLDRDQVDAKAGSAGVPHFFTDVRVVDLKGNDVAPGEKGEVVVQGPNVMRGYWDLPDETAAAIDEAGWFRTGDVAIVDEDGFVSLVDRVKDMFISGGENVYPAEIEGVLHSHPAVADCAVIGVPDEKWGEVGRALVVLTPGESATELDLLAFLDGRIAGYKVPRSVRFVGELPRSASGKLLKVPLREAYG